MTIDSYFVCVNCAGMKKYDVTRCVCETQMPPIMANSNEGQDHKDKYFDTSRKILSQEMTIYNMEALVSYFLRPMSIFF